VKTSWISNHSKKKKKKNIFFKTSRGASMASLETPNKAVLENKKCLGQPEAGVDMLDF